MNKSAATQATPQGQGQSQARRHAPEVGLRAPVSPPSAWVQAFLAFLLSLFSIIPQPDSPEGREAAQALQELRELLARYTRGELTAADRRPSRHRAPRVRLPRSQRRIQLVPGIYAALFFTPRAAIAARARFAAAEPGVAAALRALSRTSVSIFGHSAYSPTHAHFVPLS